MLSEILATHMLVERTNTGPSELLPNFDDVRIVFGIVAWEVYDLMLAD